MQFSYSRKKYQSLIISVLLHVLLLLLLFMIKMSQRFPSEEDIPEKRTTPAQVSFEKRSPVSMPVSQAAAPSTLPTNPTPEEDHTSEQSTLDAAQTPLAEDSRLPSESQQLHDDQEGEASDGSSGAPGSNASNDEASGTGLPRATARTGRRKRKSSISGAAFMNAFRQSVHTERTEASNAQSSSESGVQKRLEDWAQSHYIDRINRAIRKATLFSTKYMHLDEDIEKTVILEIPIEKNGTLGKMADVITGIEAADEFIKSVLRNADLPPLPKRFNKERFIYKVSFGVSLKKGTNYGRIHWG